MNIERRLDCEEFEAKKHRLDCGDCQTDGHYLCAGCKNIAPFDDMELWDNRVRYYPDEQKAMDEAYKKQKIVSPAIDQMVEESLHAASQLLINERILSR